MTKICRESEASLDYYSLFKVGVGRGGSWRPKATSVYVHPYQAWTWSAVSGMPSHHSP
jgi:hypothetical protein